ncbi:hypothetical protein [Streptomyces sp. NBC_00096]|uniref:Orn/Lys/Arg family decarboxylase n=1 Tax=Streptomyces sp. NBC_00096 TaxID=2975650 RepID=UPI0032554EB7
MITNSTYDGLCYDTVQTARALAPSTPRLHFDEAWFAHARFHPLYAGRYGMAVGPDTFEGDGRPTVFATQSTHKLLAALSQSAMVHVKSAPRAPVDHHRFNEAFMMHGTTSAPYPVIASLDAATAMMDGPQGEWLVNEVITEAIRFRQTVVRTGRRIADAGDRLPWFFGVWQPDTVTDPADGTERLPPARAAGRVAAAMVTVTPPGIPVLMPGGALGATGGPVLRYLGALEAFDRAFPGLHSEAHGVTVDPDTGDYLIECVREGVQVT